MDFIEAFDGTTGTVTKISSTASNKLVFPESYQGKTIKIIGTEACSNNNNIIELDFGQTFITVIKSYAFSGNSNLERITLPPTVVTIELSAFYKTKISEITIPSSTETFDGAFALCSNLNSINVDQNSRFISQTEGVYNSDFTVLIKAYANVAFETISHFDTIKAFGKAAFSKTNLNRFTSTDKITELSMSLFEECSDLVEVDLLSSSTITSIGAYCFRLCKSLTTIILPAGIKTLGVQAFDGCGLKSIFLPSSLADVGTNAFISQTYQTRVYYFGLKNFDVDVFQSAVSSPIIYVPINYKYDTLFKKPVKRVKFNEMFLVTDKCPNTHNINDPFAHFAHRIPLFCIFFATTTI